MIPTMSNEALPEELRHLSQSQLVVMFYDQAIGALEDASCTEAPLPAQHVVRMLSNASSAQLTPATCAVFQTFSTYMRSGVPSVIGTEYWIVTSLPLGERNEEIATARISTISKEPIDTTKCVGTCYPTLIVDPCFAII